MYNPALQTAGAALVFVDGLLLVFLLHAEHTRSVQPSTLITVYLLVTLLFDCVAARTLWGSEGAGVIARLLISTAAVKLVMLATEAWEKRAILLAHYQRLSPEATSGILSLSVFWWLNPLLKTGFGRFLTDQDLYCPLTIPRPRLVTNAIPGTRFMMEWLQAVYYPKFKTPGNLVCDVPD